MGGIGKRYDNRHQQHHEPGPFEQHSPEILEHLVRTKDIQENFVNDAETQERVNRRAQPICIEIPLVVFGAAEWKGHSEDANLNHYVSKENGKQLVQLATPHDRRNCALQQRLSAPEIKPELTVKFHGPVGSATRSTVAFVLYYLKQLGTQGQST